MVSAAAADAVAPTVTCSRAELLIRYNAWLRMELRLLAREMFPDAGAAAEDLFPTDAHVTRFHFPAGGQEQAPPSSRAALVLAAVGVNLGPAERESIFHVAEPGEAPEPDPHIEWAARLQDLLRPARAKGLNQEAYEALMDEIFALRDLIAETPALTLPGATAQIRVTVDAFEGGCGLGECEIQALKNATETLERLQAEA
jgi:hypothetical protein